MAAPVGAGARVSLPIWADTCVRPPVALRFAVDRRGFAEVCCRWLLCHDGGSRRFSIGEQLRHGRRGPGGAFCS
eukprot:11183798-Lingulodinium_polyedra.AAC.1